VRKLAILIVRHRWVVLVLSVVAIPVAGIVGSGVHDRLTSGGLEDPAAESAQVRATLKRTFPQASLSDFVLVVTVKNGTVDDPEVKRAGTAIVEDLASRRGILAAGSYWTYGDLAQLRSVDKQQALIVASMSGAETPRFERAGELADVFTIDNATLSTEATGEAVLTNQISERARTDLERSELLTAPITAIALVIVFGSIMAALLPFAVGVFAVVGTLLVLLLLTLGLDISVFALNLTTAMGLGLGIDYSLFIVSRYREELAKGASSNVAVGRSMQTAGRTVLFSAGTVMVSLSALVIFDIPYLRSFAFAGVAVVALGGFAAVVILPAVLAVLGPRVEKGRMFKVKPESETGGFWGAQARRVMKHPVPYALGVSAILLVLAVPFLRLNLGIIDDRVVPPSVTGRHAVDQIRENFESREADAIPVYLPDARLPRDEAELKRYATELARLPGAARVDSAIGFFLPQPDGKILFAPIAFVPAQAVRFESTVPDAGTFLNVTPAVEPMSKAGNTLVRDIRATPTSLDARVTGLGARLIDTKESVLSKLPWALGLVGLATFILLFLMTGSLLVPLKALVLNVLSLTATFGAMVWIFQEGNLSGPLNFTSTGTVDVFTPILMFCIAFGMSMDYEVFLLSRIKEEYDLDRNNEHAVVVGLQKTGRIVTAAALLLTIVFIGIATSDVAILKMFGIGLGLAVLVDAFLIRATLVPAFMRLAGRSNWWAPRFVRRFHLRYGIWENEPIAILDREFEATTA
jgi:RND superfamily putative drug exporter